jgi:HPt (histidine-containing phosphotransfer) domain-containing protein
VKLQFWRSQSGTEKSVPGAIEGDALGAEMEGLRARFGKRMRDDYAVLARYRPFQSPPAEELVSTVHRLAGAAGMLGFTKISEVAGRLDDEFAERDTSAGSTLVELLRILEETISPENSNRS